MRVSKSFRALAIWMVVFTTILALGGTRAAAQTETVLYSFGQTGGYANPVLPPIIGTDGSLYGTVFGGSTGSSVYQLTLSADGTWSEAIIGNLPNGNYLTSVCSLVSDPAGNLYGVTAGGGESLGGTVFELSPGPTGWTETILHNFSFTGKDGNTPSSGLTRDHAGNLYGMTNWGGGSGGCENNGCGTVFELSPTTGGGWTETILHAFLNKDEDGQQPSGTLVMDAAGNLYGTTQWGGTGVGVAFELTPVSGVWKEKILHRFSNNGKDGYSPLAGLAFDSRGNLFGTTPSGGIFQTGSNNGGTAFELIPAANGGWQERIIHNFGGGDDGGPGLVQLLIDSEGNLYGTTVRGGLAYEGDVFELSPSSGGSWKETRLHSFDDVSGSDGTLPSAGLVFGPSGVLYGVTGQGGTYGMGTVFEVTP